jgi:hypothetical protein
MHALAPPGYYMIHVSDSSHFPSTAQIIKIPGTGSVGTSPAQVAGLTEKIKKTKSTIKKAITKNNKLRLTAN